MHATHKAPPPPPPPPPSLSQFRPAELTTLQLQATGTTANKDTRGSISSHSQYHHYTQQQDMFNGRRYAAGFPAVAGE